MMSFREGRIKKFRKMANEGVEQVLRTAKEETKRYIVL